MVSPQTFILILVLVVAAVAVIVFIFTSQIKKLKQDMSGDEQTVLMEWLKEMKGSVERNTDTLEKQLKDHRETLDQQMRSQRESINQQTKLIWERLDNSTDVIREVQKQLGGLEEFSGDMKDLSNVLKSPKLRGGLGEQFLYEILGSSLPKELYATQYKFKNGHTCDAVIFTDKGFIPIDSKFPMENFKAMLLCESEEERLRAKKVFLSDVKNRIDEIATKYVLPEEGTTEQAVMYIPSENIFYELVVNTPQAEDYARNKNVIMTSPNTLSYFLKVILVAYRQQTLATHAKEILQALAGIRNEVYKFDEDLGVLARHISNSYKSMDGVRTKFQRLAQKIDTVETLEDGEKRPLLEKVDEIIPGEE